MSSPQCEQQLMVSPFGALSFWAHQANDSDASISISGGMAVAFRM